MMADTTEIFDRGLLSARGASSSKVDSDGIDLQQLMWGIWRDRSIIVIATLLFGFLAAVLVYQISPRYTAISKVLLDPREHQFITNEQVVSDLKLSDQVVASEISILQSNLLIEAVIGKIDTTDPTALELLDPANRDASLFERGKSALKTVLNFSTPQDPVSDEILHQARVERLTWEIRRNVDFWREGDAYIIAIKAETGDAHLSALLASTFAEEYITQQLDGRRGTAIQATEWIEQRVADLRLELDLAEDLVEDYRAQSLVNHGSTMEIISQRMLNLNEELVKARVERIAAESRHSEILRLLETGGFVALGNMLTSEAIIELNAQRIEIMNLDAQWAERFDEEHSERRKFANKLAEVDRALGAEFQRALDAQRIEVQIARIREQTMRETLDEVEEKFLLISRSSIGLRQLEREAEAARVAYNELLNRVAETRTQEKFQKADARIIERATVPGAPSAPRPKLVTLLGLLAGAALGFSFAVYRQLTNTTYRSVSDLEQDTGLPVFSVLPEGVWKTTKGALKEIESDPVGQLAESVRTLRNELSLDHEDAEPQSIALLSALPNEGKTTTTILLARLTEMTDKLVVVVDCDFRQNSLQSEFQWPVANCFTDVIHGNCSLLDAVYTETGLGFDVLVPQQAHKDAADILQAEFLQDVLEELKNYYDVVLVNCPPMLPVANSTVIARAVDQRILLVRQNATSNLAVKRCLSMLDHNDLDLVGCVITRADSKTYPDGNLYRYGY